jgi:multicomponent K+:H+ antiporter subunit D
LFLLVDLIAKQRGKFLDTLAPAPAIARETLFGAMYILAAIAIVGLPPLSGFIGKLLILDASRDAPGAALIWAVVLGASLLMMIGFTRAGSVIFWNDPKQADEAVRTVPASSVVPATAPLPIVVVGLLLAATAALSFAAGPFTNAFESTSRQLLDRNAYVRAVLGPDASIRKEEN